ncbi:MAG: hypothetical protein ACMUIE_06040 [Thermoplasmatota archaeon]
MKLLKILLLVGFGILIIGATLTSIIFTPVTIISWVFMLLGMLFIYYSVSSYYKGHIAASSRDRLGIQYDRVTYYEDEHPVYFTMAIIAYLFVASFLIVFGIASIFFIVIYL